MDQCDDSMIPSGFPNELRVLAVDDDAFSLKMLERLLLQCGYKVTVAQHAHEALKLLRENKDVHDLVISDVNMPDMDGFKLLEIVGLEMDLPVIMLSVDCDVKSVMKGIMHGAVDYLVKPVRLEELKVIWKHVARKSLKEMKDLNDLRNKFDPASQAHDVRDSPLIQNFKNHRKERDFTDSADSDDDSASQKKPRVTWTAELHTEFINAVNQLGLDRAVPKRILDIMNIPGLSRENVASHLQKYRRGLKRNGVGLSEHFNADAGTSGYAGSSNFVTLNNQCPSISLENFGSNRCRTIPAPSSSFPAHQSHGGHATMPPAWLTHPFSHHSDLGQQYTISLQSRQFVTGWQHSINPQTNRLVMENPDIITNSLVMNASNQASYDLSNRPFFPRSNQQNSYTHTSQNAMPRDSNSSLSSTSQLGYAIERQNTGTLLNDTHLERCSLDCLSTELNTMLPSEQEQQQYSACSGVDAEIEVLVNCDLVDANSNIIEDLYQSSPFDLIIVPAGNPSLEINASLNDCSYEDELHAALKQFRS